MAELKDRIKTTLDEARMLVLGSQVLLGFQYRAVFEPGFSQMSRHAQYLQVVALVLLLVVVALLMAPGAYHQIVEQGEDHEDLLRLGTLVMCIALFPFACAMALDLYVATEKLASRTTALIVATTTGLVAIFCWYGLEVIWRRGREAVVREKQAMEDRKDDAKDEGGAKLKDKIDQVLTEIRVVLPGAQALLGFQFAGMLIEGFDKLPLSSKYIHLASLCLLALSIIFMMAPAAYHRIVEQGHESEDVHRFAGRMLIAAMAALALGVSGDFFVVIRKVTESTGAGVAAAVVVLVFFYGFWFGFTFYRRSQRQQGGRWAGEYKRAETS